jgi:serine/threonine-protein kinase
MSTPSGNPDNTNTDATLQFQGPGTDPRPASDQTLDQPEPPPAPDGGGGTLIYTSTDAPILGQQTLDLSGKPVAPSEPDPTVANTGMWSSVQGEESDADFSLSSKAGATFAPEKAGEIEPLPDVPQVPGYEILGELGRGAMGVVYKARQVGLKRVVALKMILAGGYASRTEILRFHTEAEAVARLQHPNIVQVFETGEYRGLPFFSLEFVDGGCLSDRLIDQPLPIREAAELVRKLALAMASAHEHGIVHRDLKPANVLMTKDGEPKITDFGLAKKLEEDSGATRAGSIMGTPSYMAPEQAEGRPDLVGPHSDVYALGAILYDLLTGRPPFRGTTVLETLTQVRLVDPVPPARLLPQMPRDLETICLKCLNKEAVRRYHSARALAEDLRRFLAGEPIKARPVSSLERAWKWSKRNPAKAGLFAVSVLSVLMMGVFLIAYAGVQSKRRVEAERLRAEADQQRDRAKARFKDARDAVDQMLTRIGEERLEDVPGMDKVRRDLLLKAAAFYQRFLQEEDPAPEVRQEAALAARKVGDILAQLGRVADAEASLRRSLSLTEKLVEEDPDTPGYREDLAATSINLANLLRVNRRLKEADRAYARAINFNQKLVAERPGDVGRRRELSKAHYNRALLEEALGRPAAAALSLREARELQEKLAEELPGDPALKQELARAWTVYGRVKSGQPDEAEKALRRGLGILESMVKDAPENRATRQELLLACNQLGDLLHGRRPSEAGPLFARAVVLGRGLVRDYPTVPDYQQELAAGLNGLALWHLAAGRRDEADKAFAEAVRLKGRLASSYPDRLDFRLDLAKSQGNVGLSQQTAGRVGQAREAYRRAVTTLRELAEEHPDVAAYEQQLALALVRLASVDGNAAEVELGEALAIQGRLAERDGRSHEYRSERARTELTLAGLLQQQRRLAEAEPHLRRAEADFRDLVKRYPEEADDRLMLGSSLINLSDLCRRLNRPKDAEAAGREAADLLSELAKEKPGQPLYALEQTKALNMLGFLYRETGRLGDAEARQREALAIRRRLAERHKGDPMYRKELAGSHAELAIVLAFRNNFKGAEEQFKEAIDLLEQLHAAEPVVTDYIRVLVTQHNNVAELFDKLGREDDAVTHWRRAVALKEELTKLDPSSGEALAELGRALHGLAARLMAQRRPDEARPCFEGAIRRQKQALEKEPKSAAFAANLRAHQLGLADLLASGRDHAGAAKAVAEAIAGAPANWPQFPVAAALLARCVSLAQADGKLDEKARKEIANGYGDQAVALLRKAATAGFRDAEALRKAKEFASLQEREDFQKLLEGMGKKGPPGGK